MLVLAYVLLLVGWVLFVPVAVGGRGVARRWAIAAVVVGAIGLVREVWTVFVLAPRVVAPIRLDILPAMIVLAGVDAGAAIFLWRAGFRRSSGAAMGLVVLAALAAVRGWTAVTTESRRLDETLAEGHRLLFQAKFRNRQAYDRYFGMTEVGDGFPAGHWVAVRGSAVTRLVVSPDGQAFAFYRCGVTECQEGPGVSLASVRGGWEATLEAPGVGSRRLRLWAPAGDTMQAGVDASGVMLARAAPPLFDRAEPEALRYVGAYSSVEPRGPLAGIGQVWLWAQHDTAWAVAVLAEVVAGRREDFLTVEVLGRGVPAPDGWRFTWSHRGRPTRATLQRRGDRLTLSVAGGDRGEAVRTLAPGAVVRDEVVELAPRTTAERWQHWFAVQLVAHFASVQVPDSALDAGTR